MLSVTVKHEIDPNVRERLFVQAVKAGMVKALLTWHKAFAPRHFSAGAAARYNYQPRSEKYLRRKERVKHHRQPLVWSGTLRDSITKSLPTPKFKTDKGSGNLAGYIVFKVPKYAYQYWNKSTIAYRAKDKRGHWYGNLNKTGAVKMEEVFRTTDFEAGEMGKIMTEELANTINSAKRPYRRKIGAA